MRTLLVLGLAGSFAGSFLGCTVVTSDPPLDAATTTDTGVATDTGAVDDTGTSDAMPETPAGFAVIVKANDLVGGMTDDIRDYGGGSTRLDIEVGGRIAYAIAKAGTIESNPIGNAADGSGRVDGRLVGLPTGAPVTITVTGYLRGLNGNNADAPMTRIPWATTTCTATPSATADVVATCAKKLELIPTLSGIVFTSDVLQPDYCAGKGKTEFDLLRARIPATGSAVVSKTVNDCLGVIWVPESEFAAQEAGGVSTWRLGMEPKGSAAACSLTDANLCRVDRKTGAAKIDIFVVGEGCRLSNATTGGTCF